MAHTARNYKYEGQKRIFLLTFAGSNATQTAVAAAYSPVLDYWSETVFDQTYAFPNTDITRTAAMAWVSGSFKLIFNNDTQWNEKRGELITLRSADDLIYCRMYQNSSYDNYYFYPPAEEIVEDFAFLEDPEITLLSSWTAEIKWKTNQ